MKARSLGALTAALALGIGALVATPAHADEAAFPDPGLRACVAAALTSAGLPDDFGPANLAELHQLSCSGSNGLTVADLTGIGRLTGLTTLRMSNSRIVDVSPLAPLAGLRTLELYSYDLADASGLASLTGLHSLRLNAPHVHDVDYVGALAELEWVDLEVGTTADVSAVWARTNLTFMGLPVNPDTDLSMLPTLTRLRWLALHTSGTDLPPFELPPSTTSLSLSTNDELTSIANLPKAPQVTYFSLWIARHLTSLQGMEGLTGLTNATIQVTDVADISALAGLTSLQTLTLSSAAISDIRPLAGLTGLTYLGISSNRVTDLSPLSGLNGITALNAGQNAISDLTPLAGHAALRDLYLSNNPATDLTPLASLPALRTLQWWYTKATDLSALAGMPSLTTVEMRYGRLTTLGPRGGLRNLKRADFSGHNDLVSVVALEGATELTDLDLNNNWMLADITPLSTLPGTARVSLYGDAIKDLSPLPDTVTYTAHRQNAYFAAVTAGTAVDLGIRDVDGTPLCPTFSTPGPLCTNGVVTYPSSSAGYVEGIVGSGTEPGAGLGMKFVQYVYRGSDFVTTHRPIIRGVPAVGRGLRASVEAWTPTATSLTYQWRRAGLPIPQATSASYVATPSDRGAELTVCVTGHRAGYSDRTRCSSPSSEIGRGTLDSTPRPTISGGASTDAVLSAVPGSWDSGAVLNYQWQRNGRNISGATGPTYSVRASDVGDHLRVRVKATATGYYSHTEYSKSVTVRKALFVPVVPTVAGDARVGSTLTADPGAWAPAPVKLAYQWYRSGRAIAKATASSYQVTPADEGKAVTVTVTASRPGYYTSRRTSVPTAAVVAA